MIHDDQLPTVASVFKAMGEVSRLRLLQQLMLTAERSVGDLAQLTGLSQANVSKHLKNLAQADLVATRRDGNTIYYRIHNPMVREICRVCCAHVIDESLPLLARAAD